MKVWTKHVETMVRMWMTEINLTLAFSCHGFPFDRLYFERAFARAHTHHSSLRFCFKFVLFLNIWLQLNNTLLVHRIRWMLKHWTKLRDVSVCVSVFFALYVGIWIFNNEIDCLPKSLELFIRSGNPIDFWTIEERISLYQSFISKTLIFDLIAGVIFFNDYCACTNH